MKRLISERYVGRTLTSLILDEKPVIVIVRSLIGRELEPEWEARWDDFKVYYEGYKHDERIIVGQSRTLRGARTLASKFLKRINRPIFKILVWNKVEEFEEILTQ